MQTAREQPQRIRSGSSSWPVSMMLDDLVDKYVDLRQSAKAVAGAYARWASGPSRERALRFAAYTATLDQEQNSAAAYEGAVGDLERWLRRCESRQSV